MATLTEIWGRWVNDGPCLEGFESAWLEISAERMRLGSFGEHYGSEEFASEVRDEYEVKLKEDGRVVLRGHNYVKAETVWLTIELLAPDRCQVEFVEVGAIGFSTELQMRRDC